MRRFAMAALGGLLLASAASAQVVINEVFTGTPDHIELRNCSGAPIDVSGWTVASSYATVAGAAPTLEATLTLPAGTIIPSGGFLICEENGTAQAPGTLPNSISSGFNYFWVANRTLEVWLLDAGGNGVDYVYRNVFNNGTAPNLPAGTNWTGSLTSGVGDDVARNTDLDSDDALDWTIAAIPATTNTENAGQVPGACGVATPVYETNSPEASADIDGVTSSGFAPAVTTISTCGAATFTLDSSIPGTSFELAFSLSPLVPAGAPGSLTTSGGQIINIDLTSPTTAFLNGGMLPAFLPFPGPLSFPVSLPVPFTASAQLVVLDASNPDLISLSQGVQLDIVPTSTVSGPTSDDGTTLVDLTTLCGAVDFFGTPYTQIGVNANGRVTMGGVDGDFSPTVAEAQTDLPMVGYWTDMNPALGGSINIVDSGNLLSIDWVGVPYFGEAATANTFSITFDRSSGFVSITNLLGIQQNPATGVTTSDAVFFGVSPGNAAAGGSATDPGSLTFAAGGSGNQAVPTDMIYDAFTGAVAGTPYISGSLAAGTLSQVQFFALGGQINWIGL